MRKERAAAPVVDSLLQTFDHGFVNPSPPTEGLKKVLEPLFRTLSDLKSVSEYSDAKSIWITFPRGEPSDFGDYEEMKAYGEVSSYEEYEQAWKDWYPDETVWYRLDIVENRDRDGTLYARGVAVNNDLIINALMKEPPPEYDYQGAVAEKLCPLLTDAAEVSMNRMRDGTYNSWVASSLPWKHRAGVIKRNALWKYMPETKENVRNGLKEDTLNALREPMISSGHAPSDTKPADTMSRITIQGKSCQLWTSTCGLPTGGMKA